MSRSRLLPALALALLSAEVHSLGIGEIISQPRLGERLRIEVRLLTDGSSQIDPGCIQLAPGDNTDDLPWVRGARLRVQREPRPTLVIESNEAINHPVYLLGLKLNCGAEVRREFTLMPQAPVDLPAVSSRIPSALASDAAIDGAGRTTAETGGSRWVTVEGETLAGIASALFLNDSARQRRFVRESVRANPSLFQGVADPTQHPLPGGESLALPGDDVRRTDRVPPRPKLAKSSLARNPSAGRATRDADVPPTARAKSAPQPGPNKDRLSVASGSDSESGLKFSMLLDDARSRGLTEEQRERIRQEQRLIAELDEKIIASLALAEKIRNMEGYLEKLQGDMLHLDQRIQSTKSGAATTGPVPAVQTATPAAPSVTVKTDGATPAEEYSIPWTYLLMGAAAGLAGWLWWRRRRPEKDVYVGPVGAADTVAHEEPQEPSADDTVAAAPKASWTPTPESFSLELEDQHDQDNRIGVAEHDSALELAEIMLSFGRLQGAAQTLTDYIHTNPRQAIRPWLKLFEIYHVAGMRAEFEALVEQFHRNFNVQKITWDEYAHDLARASLEDLPHLAQEVVSSWGSPACLSLLQGHLHDNREGTRMGFPIGVVDDIATLVALLEARFDARPASVAQAAAA